MTPEEYDRVIAELERLIADTRATLARFEETGMDERMPEDHQALLEIYDKAVKDQRAYTLAMLDTPDPSAAEERE
ncbi:hypothetical protein [Halomonas sp. BC04]|uniref:hypothetical protein n=1 Tax=Halomonas sp. BC04 TaxID=1403540 RepID=UPI0003ED7335|nr:hypothetical protein [Halomonas sp. BC04]EWH00827.1 hypothetical protein Q427_17385 [Halomonas sp. BC04]